MLFIGLFKELDGVDALIKLFRSRGKRVKGLHALHAFMAHAQLGRSGGILTEKSCSSRLHFYSERIIFVRKTTVR